MCASLYGQYELKHGVKSNICFRLHPYLRGTEPGNGSISMIFGEKEKEKCKKILTEFLLQCII